MAVQLTAIFRKVPEGYIGFVEELPAANTQGATLEEARASLREAAAMVLEASVSWQRRLPVNYELSAVGRCAPNAPKAPSSGETQWRRRHR